MYRQSALTLVLCGALVSALQQTDRDGDGIITEEERNTLYRQNWKPFYNYEVPAAATVGRAGFYCPNTTVLEDSATGWRGECQGLTYNAAAKDSEACKQACQMDMNCSIWQWSGKTNAPLGPAGDTQHCYMGSDFSSCRSAPGTLAVVAAQRIQHGGSFAVEELKGVQVLGLKKQPLSQDYSGASEEEQQERCRAFCASNVDCSVWQWKQGNDSSAGCWLESWPGSFETGMSTNATESPVIRAFVAGQRLGRSCSPPPSPDNSWLYTAYIILGCIAVLLGFTAFYIIRQQKAPAKMTRAIKVSPVKTAKTEEEPLVPLFVPQPIAFVPVPMQSVVVVNQAPEVRQVSPIATAAAAPQVMYQPIVQQQQQQQQQFPFTA